MNESKKFILSWGIHCGTLTSHDDGEPYRFDTEQECINKANELKKHFAKMGYKIWYAYIISPDGERKEIMSSLYY